MNVLVVSENYNQGGLETHINTLYKSLKNDINFVFAFSNYIENGYLQNAKIYTGLHLNYGVTIKDFCEDVSKLIEIIKNEKIDVVHIHPFYSIFAPIFAANLTNVKLVYTYHGYGSINFVSGINDTLLFMFAVESRINKIFCVASNVLEYFNSMHNHDALFLPNLIYEDDFPIHKISNEKKWALISRLDSDKYPSIVKFLDMLKELDISKIDIYGSGNMEDELKLYLKNRKISNKVHLKGFINNLNKHLDNYTGVIGLGRVVQESLCMNYPTIFIGYGKVAGLVDKTIYNKVKDINFVPSTLDDIDIKILQKQILDINNGNYKKYQMRNTVIKDFGKDNAIKYISELDKIEPNSIDVLNKIYNDISKISDKNDMFYNSKQVYDILYTRLSFYSKNINFKNVLSENQKYFNLISLNENNKNQIQELENKINNSTIEIDKRIEDLKFVFKEEFEHLLNENANLSKELKNYQNGKLYKISTKIYSLKSKFKRKK